jgi:hypothetical protein
MQLKYTMQQPASPARGVRGLHFAFRIAIRNEQATKQPKMTECHYIHLAFSYKLKLSSNSLHLILPVLNLFLESF